MTAPERPDPQRLSIDSGWLVYDSGRHTCAGGTPESSGHHEPGCGLEPLMTVEDLAGLFDAVDALGVPINRVPQALSAARAERAEAQGDYELLRDCIIDQLNPRDDDIGEPSLMVEAVEAAARFIDSLPCTCPPDAGEPEWESLPCGRCQSLGRARDERIDR